MTPHGTYAGMEREIVGGGFTPQRYEKFFNWQWILGNGQWKIDNRQLFFAKLCLNRWDATICMGARSYIYRDLHIDAWCILYSCICKKLTVTILTITVYESVQKKKKNYINMYIYKYIYYIFIYINFIQTFFSAPET